MPSARTENGGGAEQRPLVPIPDPTERTIESLLRENAWLREVIETRLDGMDKAIKLLQDTADKFPARMDEKIEAAVGIHEEKFSSIATQFEERDKRGEREARDNKLAVDAAFAAQEKQAAAQNKSNAEASNKSESSITGQITTNAELVRTEMRGMRDAFNDMKDRVTRLESEKTGSHQTIAAGQASGNYVVGIVSAIIAVVAVAVAVAALLKH